MGRKKTFKCTGLLGKEAPICSHQYSKLERHARVEHNEYASVDTGLV
jgi:hypothetical protein